MASWHARFRAIFSPIRSDDALDRSDGLAAGALLLLSVWVFRLHFFGLSLFLGNPDRLNNNLKVQKYFVDSLVAGGGVQAWNDHELLGYNTFGLPYTYPNPLTYVLAAFGPDNLYAAAGYLSVILIALSGFTAYLFLRDAVRDKLSALVGAVLYQLCTLTILKVSQNDMSFIVLALCPLLFLQVRASSWQCAPARFLWIGLVLFFYFQFAFLQKVAYVILAAGIYAIVLARSRRNWAPVVIFACAGVTALTIASPRIVGLVEMLRQYARVGGNTAAATHSYAELLRFFDPFIFGSSFTDASRLGNPLNLSEGWLLYLSGAAPMILALALWASFRRRSRFLPSVPRAELIFFWGCAFVASGVLLNLQLATLIYNLFLRMDFIHARVLIVATLPACVLISGGLAMLRLSSQGLPSKGAIDRSQIVACLIAAVLLVALIELFSRPAGGRSFIPIVLKLAGPEGAREWALTSNWIAMQAALRAAFTVVITALIVILALRKERWTGHASYVLAAIAVLQVMIAAERQVNGPAVIHAPVPFANGDLYQAPHGTFQMPSHDDKMRVRQSLESDRFRSIAICDPLVAGGFCAPHVGERWGLRLADGYYGLGTPSRLAEVPLGRALGLRHVVFTSASGLPWEELGLLNVKYAILVTPEIYGNRKMPSPAAIRYIENPNPVTPRAFFAERVVPIATPAEAVMKIFRAPERTSLEKTSFVESFPEPRDFSGGEAHVTGGGDTLEIRFQPRQEEGFLVINELYDPRWNALIAGAPVPVYAANAVMRGVLVPQGVATVKLEFVPFPRSTPAELLRIAGLLFGALSAWLLLRKSDKIPNRIN